MTLALFDFDGTITTSETMPQFVRGSVSGWRLIFGQLFLAPLIFGYWCGLVSGPAVRRAIVRVAYTGTTVAALKAHGEDFARDVLPAKLRPEMMQRIVWHKAQGHTVVVVSGGLDVYLAPRCHAHDLDLICSTLQDQNGVLTGRYLGRQCVMEEKARRVGERYDLANVKEIYAYGDTPEDEDLLSIATHRYYRGHEVVASGRR